MIYVLIFLLQGLFLVHGGNIFAPGDYKRNVIIQSLHVTNIPGSAITLYAGISKYNRTHTVVTANATIFENIDEKFSFDLEAQLWSDGGWKANAIKYRHNDPCNQLQYLLGNMWLDVLDQGNVSHQCPYEKGFHHIDNYYIDAKGIPLIYKPGKFKGIFTLLRQKKTHFFLEVVIEILPVI